jgi:hypothetical protein
VRHTGVMDTTAAAAKAGVTASTIRTWCRRGAVTAVKTGGKWTIDEASLTRRIALSDRPAETAVTRGWAGRTAVTGPAHVLAAAFATGTAVTITAGPFKGENVHLGYSNSGRGILGLDRTNPDGTAVYLVDVDRLDDAPRLSDYLDEGFGQAMENSRQADADERAYLNPRYM